jgi:D-beta-D-heptose 7-phosphate kinase / D-beta-D-heptose 1-phosphate adenosyltransferase
MKLVLACGCFDVLHPGHIAHLKAARKLGTRLHVALTVDEEIGKGVGRPLFPWNERAEALRSLRCVGTVTANWRAILSIKLIRPNIYVKGYEYRDQDIPEREICAEMGIQLVFLKTIPVYSSTRIMNGEMWRDRIKAS